MFLQSCSSCVLTEELSVYPQQPFFTHLFYPYAPISIDNDDKYLYSGFLQTIKQYEIKTGKMIKKFEKKFTYPLYNIRITPNNKYLIANSFEVVERDREVGIWNIEGGKFVNFIDIDRRGCYGNNEFEISSDSKILVYLSDFDIYVYNLNKLKIVHKESLPKKLDYNNEEMKIRLDNQYINIIDSKINKKILRISIDKIKGK